MWMTRVDCVCSPAFNSDPDLLQVQGVTKRPQGRFLHCFTQRRVCVNGAGYILQTGAHFQ